MNRQRKAGIFFAALIVAVGGIIYEMIIGSAATFLLGNSVLHFSLTIGFFLFGMGIGSILVPIVNKNAEQTFVLVETILGTLGGFSVFLLFSAFAFSNITYLVFVLLVTGIGALIGTEIPLLLSILREESGSRYLLLTTRILSLDYLGALIASFVFPLIMLPQFGLLRSSFMVGILNLLVALLMIVSFQKLLQRKFLIAVSWTCGMILLCLGFVFSQQLSSLLNSGLFQDEVVYAEQSQYQSIVFTKFNEDLRLYLDGNIQFSSIDEKRYHEAIVHVPVALGSQPVNVLVLGGGDGLVVRELLNYNSIEKIDLVDLDPAVVKLAQEYLPLSELNEDSLSDPKVSVKNADAFTYLQETAQLYDLIVIDLPDPNNESLAKLYSLEFYQLAARHLSVQGVMVTQAVSPYFTPKTFFTIEQTISAAGLHTLPYHINVPSFGEWGFVAAAHESLDPNKISSLPETNEVITSAEIAKALFVFDSDMEYEGELSESTLFNPTVLFSYEEEASLWQ